MRSVQRLPLLSLAEFVGVSVLYSFNSKTCAQPISPNPVSYSERTLQCTRRFDALLPHCHHTTAVGPDTSTYTPRIQQYYVRQGTKDYVELNVFREDSRRASDSTSRHSNGQCPISENDGATREEGGRAPRGKARCSHYQ